MTRRAQLKEWINQPTQMQQDASNSNNILNSNTPVTLDGVESYGFTALHFASYHGNSALLDLLVDAGANVYATNR